ncbi:hypothetical protein NP493_189g05023 [Ridgeia piscesae]|uniref:Uncharacterized protein n=1 Tax=Ridgeia piscesae TaxID=27915 RepID=A0AAD9UEW6_RIDPI|nr:hypothetical protein NP493_189g05023 [Ridgeia piscesae]
MAQASGSPGAATLPVNSTHGGFSPAALLGEVDPKYLCGICKKVLRNPIQSYCGHRFCKLCIEPLLASEEAQKCPCCVEERTESEYSSLKREETFPDNATKREFHGLPAHCPNDECNWKGTFKEYESQGITNHSEHTPDRHKASPTTVNPETGDCTAPRVKCPFGCSYVSPNALAQHLDTSVVRHVNILRERVDGAGNSPRENVHSRANTTSTTRNSPRSSQPAGDSGNLPEKLEILETKVATFESIVGVLNTEIEKCVLKLDTSDRQSRTDKEQVTQANRKLKDLERQLALKDVTIAELDLRIQAVSTLRPCLRFHFSLGCLDLLHLTGRSVHSGHCLRPPSTPHRQVSTLRPLSQATFYTSQAGQYTQATVSGHHLHLTGRSVHSGQCLRPPYTSQAGQYTQASVSGHLLHLTGRSVHSGQCLRPPFTPHRQVSTLRPVSQATFYTSQAGQYTQASVSGHILHLTGRSVHSGQCLGPPSTPHRQVSTLRPVPQATFYTSQAGQYTQASASGHLLHITGRSVHSGQCLRPPSTPHRQVSTLRPVSQATFYTSQAGQYTKATVSGHILHLTGRSVHKGHCLSPPSTPHRQVSTLRPLPQATFYTSQAGQYTQATVSGHLLHLTGRSVHSGQCLRPHSTPHKQVSTLRSLSQATFYTSQAGQYTQATASGHLLHLTGRSVHSGQCLRPHSTPHKQVSTLRPVPQATIYTSQAGQYTQASVSGHILHLNRQVSTLRPVPQATIYTSQAGQYTQASVSGHILHLTGRTVHKGHCLRPHSTPHRQVSTQRPLPQPTFYTSQAGYKMCARIYLNGDGMGKTTHVSLFFVIMRGQFDALLKWPFRQKVTMMMLDQAGSDNVVDVFRPDPTSSSFKRPTSEMNIASGCPLFMRQPQLDQSSPMFVKDDVAFIKVVVDCVDLNWP